MRTIICVILLFQILNINAQNPLVIPPSLTGTTFNLTVQTGSQVFYGSTSTPTYGINGSWLSPTIIVNKGDSVTLNVINNLPVRTTMHWHGLHVSAMDDGGPHQEIMPSSTWSPSFKIRNNAATFWYHPHGAGQTEQQVAKGLAGLLIVKDSAEAALTLPRTYGVDDIPLIIQSKAFDELQQIAIATDLDTALFVNGTLNPYFNAPAQVIRFRVLNGSSLRSYNLGFSNGQSFYQIATDGGLLDSCVALTRLIVSPGERAEILVNLSGMQSQTIHLKSFASELPTGIYGAAIVGMGADTLHDYDHNFLNGLDFNLLQINIVAPTASPVTTIPSSLVPYTPFNPANATKHRSLVMDTIRLLPIDQPNRAEGPFGFNGKTFNMDSINEIVVLNTTEVWTLHNKTLIAHPFHIHDIQFNIIEKNGLPPSPSERGWKDVVLVMPGDSVKFITKFETFADTMMPYMYHCHLLHHEDDGMMGQFLVVPASFVGIEKISTPIQNIKLYPNPTNNSFSIDLPDNGLEYDIKIFDLSGKIVLAQKRSSLNNIDISGFAKGVYPILIRANDIYYSAKIVKE